MDFTVRVLGLDTSNYTTSAALLDEYGVYRHSRRLLPVPAGEKGLRQSEAVFAHVKALPEVLAELGPLRDVSAAAVSSRPRAADGSYMPCFLAGLGLAKGLAQALEVPLYEVSHQQGHLAAALLSVKRLDLEEKPFLAWHVSGGTTELLKVTPNYQAQRIGGTADVCAGQIIDRLGVTLGMRFPCGPELERLSEGADKDLRGRLTVRETEFSLSGLQNQAEAFLRAGETPADVARYVFRSVAEALSKASEAARIRHGAMPLVCCGGVFANRLIRAALPEALCADPALSSDNAVGTARLGQLLGGQYGEL